MRNSGAKNTAYRKAAMLFDKNVALEICERVSAGELLLDICAHDRFPTVRRCIQWQRQNSDFAALYRESVNDRLDVFSEEIIKIADDSSRDLREVVRNGRTVRVGDGDMVARAKLRVEVRLKHLKALRPQIWGEQSTLITRSEDDCSNMSDEELMKKISELEDKNNIVNDKPSRAAKA
jgi:hypothetical protein